MYFGNKNFKIFKNSINIILFSKKKLFSHKNKSSLIKMSNNVKTYSGKECLPY